ncbi:SCO family protein [Pseudoneobacillus sp. C159]
MIKNRHTSIAIFIVLLFGMGLFYFGTDGFSAYTAERARVNDLIEAKPTFPSVTLEDSKWRQYAISEFKDKYVFITFMYTSCKTVCLELENNMTQVYERVPDNYKGKEVVFLSISFDPERDTPAVLDEYKNNFRSDGENWRMARIPNQTELDGLLKEFGVIVIPDEYGNFTHNSAFYLVDPAGKLIDVMDYKKVDEAADKLNNILEKRAGNTE